MPEFVFHIPLKLSFSQRALCWRTYWEELPTEASIFLLPDTFIEARGKKKRRRYYWEKSGCMSPCPLMREPVTKSEFNNLFGLSCSNVVDFISLSFSQSESLSSAVCDWVTLTFGTHPAKIAFAQQSRLCAAFLAKQRFRWAQCSGVAPASLCMTWCSEAASDTAVGRTNELLQLLAGILDTAFRAHSGFVFGC